MKLVDVLLRVYPPAWRERHGEEFHDALVASRKSGRLPVHQIRSALASGLHERARGESTTPRELLRSSLHDSLVFISGLIMAISFALALRHGWPQSWYPTVLLVLPFAVFVCSMASARAFRVLAIATGPTMWFVASTVRTTLTGHGRTTVSFMDGAAGPVVLGGLSFVGLAFALRRKFKIGAVLQLPTIAMAASGTIISWRNGGTFVDSQPQVGLRMAWASTFFALLMVYTAVASVVTKRPDRSVSVRPLHLATLAIGMAMGLAPAPVAVAVGICALALAWWNPRPALVVLTWPVSYILANFTSMIWMATSPRNGMALRFLLPLIAGVVFALFLRHSVKRVHRLS